MSDNDFTAETYLSIFDFVNTEVIFRHHPLKKKRRFIQPIRKNPWSMVRSSAPLASWVSKKSRCTGTLDWNPQLDPLHVCDWHPDCGRISNMYIFAQVVHMYTIPKRIYGFAYMNTGNY